MTSHSRNLHKLGRILATTAALALLTGCATTQKGDGGGLFGQAVNSDGQASSKTRRQQETEIRALIEEDPIAATAYWGSRYDSNPGDLAVTAAYGNALRQIGSLNRAIEVLAPACRNNPQHPALLAAYGKALASGGQNAEAASILARAADVNPDDPTVLSAAGIALDQVGDHAAARSRHEAALNLEPRNPVFLNNLALSHMLDGDLGQAETLLRQAIGLPGANAQMRQNLALILGLGGDWQEAERLSNGDLLPDASQNNMDYIRELLGQPARWNDMSGLDTPAVAAVSSPRSTRADKITGSQETSPGNEKTTVSDQTP